MADQRTATEKRLLVVLGWLLALVVYELVAALLFAHYKEALRHSVWWIKLAAYAAFVVPPYLIWDRRHNRPEKKERRGALHEARHLLRESRRMLRRRGDQLATSVRDALRAGAVQLEAALAAEDPALCRPASRTVDELLEKHAARWRKSARREYAEQIGYAILIALCLRTFVVEAFKIPSGSMIPTLLVGDHIFVNKYAYGLSDPLAVFLNPLTWIPSLNFPYAEKKLVVWKPPQRGDVAVFVNPKTRQDYIKRVVGLPGDVVDFRDGVMTVNGQRQPKEYLGEYSYEESPNGSGGPSYTVDCALYQETIGAQPHLAIQRRGGMDRYPGPWVVEPDHVFVVGDNRDNSADSRVPLGLGQIPLKNLKGRAMVIWLSLGGDWGVRLGRMFRGIE